MFTLSLITNDKGTVPDFYSGFAAIIGDMTCTVSTSPTTVNQNGKLVVSFVAPEFPSGSTIKV